ncbi:hypothetical protein UFOVP566_42 [uncultured Caudovirales phage]|uniref:Uncharacterized protein n=1 Tax=uncultured Caudovirales phage TaxID=2100421 RepID=A0A6J5LTH0_9CAUD|nr:hypothetical protein UFOVP294_43 [uncultured Caudovirales phage]CAB4150464.1 hypothetical protein UFOVP566_42 [uncultured Caudovirales phage]
MTGYESKKKAAQAKLDSMGREALKLALDLATMHHTDDGYAELRSKVRQFAKEALAQPAQEPVAVLFGSLPVYDTTPPQRQPLTDDEIWKFWWSRPEVPEGEDNSMEAEFVAAVRAVLAAHGIKEKNT